MCLGRWLEPLSPFFSCWWHTVVCIFLYHWHVLLTTFSFILDYGWTILLSQELNWLFQKQRCQLANFSDRNVLNPTLNKLLISIRRCLYSIFKCSFFSINDHDIQNQKQMISQQELHIKTFIKSEAYLEDQMIKHNKMINSSSRLSKAQFFEDCVNLGEKKQ